MTEYKRYQGKSYMVWSGEAKVKGYEYPMLIQNQIKGLLPVTITNADTYTQFWYDISGKNTLEEWMKIRKVGGVFLRNIITELVETMEHLGEYLLSEDGISLLPDRVYVDSNEKEIAFCYMLYEKADFREALRSFMEYYLSHMEHGDGEDVHKCYAVYEKCQEKNVCMEELLQLLYDDTVNEDVQQKDFQVEEQEVAREFEQREVKEISIKKQNKLSKNFIDGLWNIKRLSIKKKQTNPTEYVFEPEEHGAENVNPTVFLGSETDHILGELRYEGDGSGCNIKITSDIFLIGSRKEEVDGVICDETISRIHAKVTKEEDNYYIEDMNSTNGTYYNGELLNYREKKLLGKNDKITFAKEQYRFV